MSRLYEIPYRLVIYLKHVVAGAATLVIISVPAYFMFRPEFMPPLNESTILYMPITMPDIPVTEARILLLIAEADIKKCITAPMVGGLFTSFIMELLVYPAIYLLWKKHTVTGR